MCSKSELNKILSKIYDTYNNVYGKDIFKILLYGSYARGDYEKDSDIDIVAIVNGERSNLQSKLNDIWEHTEEKGVTNEPVETVSDNDRDNNENAGDPMERQPEYYSRTG